MRILKSIAIPLLSIALCGCGTKDYEAYPNIVLILIDTLRADHVSCYGYDRETTKAIDALSAEGWTFDQYIASASQTVPSTLSMLLSQYPAEHGVRHPYVGYFQENRPHFPDSMLFLAEVLSDAGYNTAGYMGNPILIEENGFAQGFDEFMYSAGPDGLLTAPAVKWMKKHL